MYVVDRVVVIKSICKRAMYIVRMAILRFLFGAALSCIVVIVISSRKYDILYLLEMVIFYWVLQKLVVILWGYDLIGVWVVRLLLRYYWYIYLDIRYIACIYFIVIITTIWLVALQCIMTIVIVWKTTLFPLLSDERLGGKGVSWY